MGFKTGTLVVVVMGLLLTQSVFRPAGSAAPIQTFDPTGSAAISVSYCYDTNPANSPVISGGRLECHPSNPTVLATSTTYTSWTIINLPAGNRLPYVATYLPMDSGEWSSAAVACSPGLHNRCTAGSVTGSAGARIDLLCDGSHDVIGAAGPGGILTSWPDSTLWTHPSLTRIAAAISLGGAGPLASTDPDSYLHALQPFPPAWDFRTVDSAVVPFVYLSGLLQVPVPWRANMVSYTSTYTGQSGLVATALTLEEHLGTPPGDEFQCLNSPLDMVWEVSGLTTPSTDTIIPRWATLESEADLGDGSVTRIIAWQCDRIGAAAPLDADGDCDPDDTDPNEFDTDVDNDLLVDGIELNLDTFVAVPDFDGDGVVDAEEMFQGTDPHNPDTDSDNQADRLDNIPTNGANVPAGNNLSISALNPETSYDALDFTEDNCPTVYNPSQINTDALWQYHGMGGNADPDGAGPLLGQNTSTGDRTNPNEDKQGDACDTDDDNDGLLDVVEPQLRLRPWSGPTDPGGACLPEPSCSSSGDVADTTVCVSALTYPGAALPIRTMSANLGDVDFDLVLDGRECAFRSRPDASCRTTDVDPGCVSTAEALNCASGAITPAASGCAQPASNASTPGGGDVDADLLYLPGSAGSHITTEKAWRKGFVLVEDIDGDGILGSSDPDSDRDTVGTTGTFSGIRDGWEVRFYGSHPSRKDSDGDGCLDGDEITDLNGDGAQNAADSGLRAQASGSHDVAPANGRMDSNLTNTQGVSRYALATNRDFNKDGNTNAADGGILAAAIAAPGGCSPYNETGLGWNVIMYP